MKNSIIKEGEICNLPDVTTESKLLSTIVDGRIEGQIYIDLVVEDYESDSLEA